MNDRRKLLEAFSKQLYKGNPLAEEYINTSRSPMSQAIQARDLAEDALANEVLKKTDVPIPSNNASMSKKEDFLNRILQERYPEFNTEASFKELGNNLGEYGEGKILVNKKLMSDPLKYISTGLHEAGHQYDDRVLKFDGTDNINKRQLIKSVPDGRMLKDIDPMQMSELVNKGHHARIPSLRDADSYGLGALKSMLKSGTFKGIAPVIAKGALATAGGLASLASEASDSEEEGSSLEQAALLRNRDEMVRRGDNLKNADDNQKKALESMYEDLDSGKAFNPRIDAIKSMAGRKY
jgi:hypothetical protein